MGPDASRRVTWGDTERVSSDPRAQCVNIADVSRSRRSAPPDIPRGFRHPSLSPTIRMSPPKPPSPHTPTPDREWVVPPELGGRPLDGVVKAHDQGSWSDARKLIQTGKVLVDGNLVTKSDRKVGAGATIAVHLRAPKPKTARFAELDDQLLVYVDAHVVVVNKPPGISTVPFGDEHPDEVTLDGLVREVLSKRDSIRGRAELGVVQRLDKATSGILVFTRNFAAKKHLGQQLRVHSVHRRYLAIANGDVESKVCESYLAENMRYGLRGSAPEGRREGQLAITHVERLEPLNGATLVGCRLETGRTHQIRIHLSEGGNPLVGEEVYIRGYGGPKIVAPRLMLHAAELGFTHPADGRAMRFQQPPPKDFDKVLARLRDPRGPQATSPSK